MAKELGKHLHELMGWSGPMTWRQSLAWHAWLDLRWNRPSLTDYYLMMLVREVGSIPARVWGKSPPQTVLKDYQLEFLAEGETSKRNKDLGMTPEQKAENAKAIWRARLARPGKLPPSKPVPERKKT